MSDQGPLWSSKPKRHASRAPLSEAPGNSLGVFELSVETTDLACLAFNEMQDDVSAGQGDGPKAFGSRLWVPRRVRLAAMEGDVSAVAVNHGAPRGAGLLRNLRGLALCPPGRFPRVCCRQRDCSTHMAAEDGCAAPDRDAVGRVQLVRWFGH